MGSTSVGARVIAGLGSVLGGLFVFDLAWSGTRFTASPGVFAGELLFGLVMPAALVGSAVWIADSEFEPRKVWRIALWSLGGLATLTALTGWQFYFRALATGSADPVQTLIINAQAGATVGVVVGIYDARASKHAERLEATRQRLRFLNQLIRHDILNAVQLIDGYVERLADDEDDRQYVDTIQLKTEEISDLIHRVRKMEQTAQVEDFDVKNVTQTLTSAVDVTASTHDVTVAVEVEPDLEVYANDLLDVVIENLLDNAVEHNDSDDQQVWVGAERRGDRVRLEVADDGPGIPDERKERIFDLEDEGGHGLGLYLVSTLVEQYGGEVWVEDRAERPPGSWMRSGDDEPRGSVFVVELPAAG